MRGGEIGRERCAPVEAHHGCGLPNPRRDTRMLVSHLLPCAQACACMETRRRRGWRLHAHERTHATARTRTGERASAAGALHSLGMACRARGSARWMGRRANLGGARAAAAGVRFFMCLVTGMASVRGLSYQGEVRVCVFVCRRVRVDCAYTQ